jgi:hypothetical protein
VDTVLFLGSSSAQFQSLAPQIREGFSWATERLEQDSPQPPQNPDRSVETKPLSGPIGLFRISVRLRPADPGCRGVYCFDGTRVLFVRFAPRDAGTYKALRRLHRLKTDRPLWVATVQSTLHPQCPCDAHEESSRGEVTGASSSPSFDRPGFQGGELPLDPPPTRDRSTAPWRR